MTIDLFTRPGTMLSTLTRRSPQGLKSADDARERHGCRPCPPQKLRTTTVYDKTAYDPLLVGGQECPPHTIRRRESCAGLWECRRRRPARISRACLYASVPWT